MHDSLGFMLQNILFVIQNQIFTLDQIFQPINSPEIYMHYIYRTASNFLSFH